jgi:amino acid transporter
MAYREKLAWIELVGMALAYGAYFIAVAMVGPLAPGREATLTYVGLFAAATLVRLLILGIGWLVLRARSGADARARPDERDRAIARRGASVAYYVLLSLMLWVGVMKPLIESGWAVANSALAAIIIAEIVRETIAVLSYRRGWHG